MPDGADVRSIAALRDWLAALANYRSEAAESLSGIRMEIRRAIDWLDEQHSLWQRAVRQCEDEVHQAKMELTQRKSPDWSGRDPDTTLQEKNLRRARARLEHAEDKVRTCRSWIVKLPKMVDESYAGPSARLQSMIDAELPAGMASLDRRIDTLERYAGIQRDGSG